jgi:hypothetical protein
MSRIQDAILSACSIGVLVGVLSMVSSDMRRSVTNVLAGDASQLVMVTEPINRAARIVVKTVNGYWTDDFPLFAFGVLGVVLFGFLYKT